MASSVVVGVWCAAGSDLLAEASDGRSLVRTTLGRVSIPFTVGLAHQTLALVPWTAALDHMEPEIKAWSYRVVRTHTDERVAMRDLCARYGSDIGVLVNGACAVIDSAEIALAVARLEKGISKRYESPRLRAFKAEDWLIVNDSEEWPEDLSLPAIRKLFAGGESSRSARELLARRVQPL